MKSQASHYYVKEILLYVGILLFIFFIINAVNYIRVNKAVQMLPPVSGAYEPVRFMLYSYADNSISARFWIYDITGKEIVSYERSWPANSLALEFVIIKGNHTSFTLPTRILNINREVSDVKDFSSFSSGGTNISNYYFKDDICLLFSPLFNSALEDDQDKKLLSSLCRFSTNTSALNKLFYLFTDSFIEKKIISLKSYKKGIQYSVRSYNGEILINP